MARNVIDFLRTIATDVRHIRENFAQLQQQTNSVQTNVEQSVDLKLSRLESALRDAFGQGDNKLTQDINSLTSRVGNLETTDRAYERRITGLENNVKAFNTFSVTASTKIQEFGEDISSLKARMTNAENKPTSQDGRVDVIEKSIDTLKTTTQSNTDDIRDLDNSVKTLRSNEERLSKSVARHEDLANGFLARINTLELSRGTQITLDTSEMVKTINNGRFPGNLYTVNSVVNLHAGKRIYGPNPVGSPFHERQVSQWITTQDANGLVVKTAPIPFCQNKDFFRFSGLNNVQYTISYFDEKMQPVPLEETMVKVLKLDTTETELTFNENEVSFTPGDNPFYLTIVDPVVLNVTDITGYLVIESRFITKPVAQLRFDYRIDLFSDRKCDIPKLEDNFLATKPTQYIGYEGDTIPYKGGVAYVKKHLRTQVVRTARQGSNMVIYFNNPKGSTFSSGAAVGLEIKESSVSHQLFWGRSVQDSVADRITVEGYLSGFNEGDHIYITEFEYIENGSV